MKIITVQTLIERIKDDAQTNRGCGLGFLVLLGLLLAGGGAMVHPILSLIVLGGFSLAAWNMLSSSYLARKSLKNMSFYLVESGCREKESKCQGEDGMAYILTFENGHCHTIDHGDICLLAGGGNDWDDEKLYDNTELGDRFFLVYFQGSKKASYIIPRKCCQLDMTGFVEENGRICPRKTP